MRVIQRALGVVIVLEFALISFDVVRALNKPRCPKPDISFLEPASIVDLRELQDRTASNTFASWHELGKAYTLFGFFQEADYCFRYAAELNPKYYETAYWWGMALNQLGRSEDAIEQFERAVLLGNDEDRQRCWFAVGRNYLRQENAAKAEAAFRAAGDTLPAKRQLARIFIRSQREEEAIGILDQLLTRYPNEQSLYQLRAQAWEAVGAIDRARADLDRVETAPDLLPFDLIVFRLQIELERYGSRRQNKECASLMESGRIEEAHRCLQTILDAQWNRHAAENLARVYVRLGRASEALALLTELNARLGTSPDRLTQMGIASMMLKREADAVDFWHRSAAMQSQDEPHSRLADHYDRSGKRELARFHRALALTSKGKKQLKSREFLAAVRSFETAVELNPQLPGSWYYLGEAFRQSESSEDAEDAYRRCLKLDPNHGIAMDRLERLERRIEPEDDAVQGAADHD